MVKEKKLYYKSKDKIKLCGLMVLPAKPKNFVLLTHGITMDKNEFDDFYKDIAHALAKENIGSLRFDFRCHGESEGKQQDMTIIGELLDVKASVEKISELWKQPITIIGTSFGAGTSILYAALYPSKIKNLILISPVLDYNATFLKPVTPWGKGNFNKAGFNYLEKHGYLLLDDEFKLGAKLIEEFQVIKPYEYLEKLSCPVLTIHGNKDSMVPFNVSEKYGAPNPRSKFVRLENAGHGYMDYRDEIGDSKISLENKKLIIQQIMEWTKVEG